MTPEYIALGVLGIVGLIMGVSRFRRLSPTLLPWTTTPNSRATAPGLPGDLGEEIIEAINEVARGRAPWSSKYESSLRTIVTNSMVAAVLLATVAVAVTFVRPGQIALPQLPRVSDRLLGAVGVGAVVGLIATLAWNRGIPWFVNLLAQDEPALAAIGGFTIALFWGTWPIVTVGAVLIVVAALARYTALLDIDDIV